MRVVVVGPGAVGSFLAATLAAGGVETVLAGRGDGAGQVRGLRVTGVGGDVLATLTFAGLERLVRSEPPDAVLLAVRQPDLAAAVASIAAWPSVAVVTVQNGIGAEALVAEARPTGPLVAAALTTSVGLLPDGSVRRLTRGGIGLSAVTPSARAIARSVASAFVRGGLRARVYRDPAAMKWSKLLANLVANATAALLDLDPADVYADPRLFEVERRQLREALEVMRRLGLRPVALPGADARLLALALRLPDAVARPILRAVVAGGRGGKSPSLRLALTAPASEASPRETEVNWLNGAVAAEGRRLGVPTPVNATLARLVGEAARQPRPGGGLRVAPSDRAALLAAIDAAAHGS